MSEKPTYEELEKQIAELQERADKCHSEAIKYRTLFDSFPYGITVSDKNGGIIETNAVAEKLLGVGKEQHEKRMIDGDEWWILRPDGSEMPKEEWAGIIALKENRLVTNCEMGIVKPGNEVVWINVTAAPLPIEGLGVVVTYNDITELKHYEKNLKESEERFRKIYTHMSVGIAQISMDFFIEHANEAYCQMLGYSEKELVGKHLKEITHPEIIKENLEKQAQLASGEIDHYRMDKKFIHKSGNLIHGILDANLVRDSTGRPLYCLGSVLDITERKQVEKALKSSEEKYRSMMESMKNPAYICSSELVIEYMNPQMIDRVGRDATGEPCYKAIYENDKKCSWCVLDNILKGEHIDYELSKTVNDCYYSVTNSPIYNPSGKVSKLTIFHDITRIKTMEAQLRHASKMESIGTIAGGIAHDFNNIIYIITGNAELAMADIPEWNPAYDSLKEIKTAGFRGAAIVRQLLNFSRRTDEELKPVGAVSVIKDALKLIRSTIPTTIEITHNFPDEEIIINADSAQINQVMMNICINAAQAMEENGGTLNVTVDKMQIKCIDHIYPDISPGQWLKITISDSGPGISNDIIERIFDPYFTTKPVGKGSGMGLSVVHGIVKSHHGAIYVDTSPEQGATFNIFFPVVAEKNMPNVTRSEDISFGNGEKILFVDDEASIVDMAVKILKRLGYHVESETNPIKALEKFRSRPYAFDVVLTDMTMPKINGIKLAASLKEINPNIPVILCTGYNSLIDEEKAKSIGIDGYTMKPIVVKEIAKTIRDVLDRKK
ncbi:putative PAS/PAC sensor hybrid histidine kinase [Desulfamplus magnetovallimortis]|uniref:histidine kinase n=2 Tax=Desulfamplus magnetovallimortis TaxID=1246637 RepID=A0A1W1HBU0_9BACT|nr:putative PAS/PAC sensor hybrid histidine kinase [Desulfamplus magnetovallimortis]